MMSRDRSRMLKPGAAAELSGKDYSHVQEEVGRIDQNLLEKRLEGLRDTQESVQGLSLWCQANKRHSSAIIETWLKILKKSPVEKRLTLFYLANDVVQHAKRKSDLPVVNQWVVAVQKAMPLVRTPSSVSTAIARIFKIWEERLVYSKETISDFLALLNNVPAKERVGDKKKPEMYTASAEKVASFHSSTLISKIKLAYRLKSHLGATFRAKSLVHMDMENLKSSIKDRSHGMEVVQEMGQLIEQIKASELKLQSEVDERRKIVEIAEIAIVHYENVRGEAKIVNAAYKNFTERVELTRDKVLDKLKSFEEMDIDSSPVPSPPREAPSPPPDDDDQFGFGIKPANSVNSASSWQNSNQNTSSIRNNIIEALQSNISQQPDSKKGSLNSSVNYNPAFPPSQSQNSVSNNLQTYGQNSVSATTMQFQHQWNASQAGNFAAMIQQMIPGSSNYLGMQQTGFPTQSGYGFQQPQTQANVPDVSAIPLPPTGPSSSDHAVNPQEIHHPLKSHVTPPTLTSPTVPNPYLSSYTYENNSSSLNTDSNEYVPLPCYKGNQDPNSSGMSYGNNYDSNYGSSPSTPKSYRFQRYQTQRSNDNNTHQDSRITSPTFSNHSGSSGSDSRFFNSGTTPLSPPESTFDPMEMFASALNKNRNPGIQKSNYKYPRGNSRGNPRGKYYYRQ